MNFRRSEFDVTNRINTTDPVCVKLEVDRILSVHSLNPDRLTSVADIRASLGK